MHGRDEMPMCEVFDREALKNVENYWPEVFVIWAV